MPRLYGSPLSSSSLLGRDRDGHLDREVEVDTVIVGNGPSSLILSYILHGHIPYYKPCPPHPDPLLHHPLERDPALLKPDLEGLAALTAHFAASRRSYSTQALPVNILLDALIHPLGEMDASSQPSSTVEWRFVPDQAVPHLVLGCSAHAGGLWADEDPVPVRPDLATLSYASMLSLPGYSFADHHRRLTGTELPAFTRPARQDMTAYLTAYPTAVGIQDSIYGGEEIHGVVRAPNGFYIYSHAIHCRHLVLASGAFSHQVPPPASLAPLRAVSVSSTQTKSSLFPPLLVIGSGFTAADVILSVPPDQPVLHLFRWDPEHRPSPLRGCHPDAYPEYAGIYRLMKRAALAWERSSPPVTSRSKYHQSASTRIAEDSYEGWPNAEITDVQICDSRSMITIRQPDGTSISRSVSGLAYVVGRRGSLSYLDPSLRAEVLAGVVDECDDAVISSQTLRHKILEDLEVASNVFVVGSLTGDSLIRFAYGACVYTAARLIMAPRDATTLTLSENEKQESLALEEEGGGHIWTGLPFVSGRFWVIILRIMLWVMERTIGIEN